MKPCDLDPILVVDDNEDDLLMFRRAAAKARLANPVVCFRDGEEAVRHLEQVQTGTAPERDLPPERRAPVLLVLDLKMPRMSGFEVLQWLRARPGLRRIPVIVFTSSSQDPDIARAYELGANSYLVKPVSFSGMIEMLSTLGLYWLIFNEVAPPAVAPSVGGSQGTA